MVRDNDDITLVTINYRLNIFGQPNPPQYSEKINVNFGLLDVHAAIQTIVAQEGDMSTESAEDYLHSLKEQHRYHRDVY